MDKKKLIGTIIGVVAFAALIAGATYAWMTNAVTITNGVYNLKSMNFLVNYSKGANINAVNAVATPTVSNTTKITVTAGLAPNSAPGTMDVYLNTSSSINAILTGQFLKYSWCKGTCGTNDFASHTGTVSSASNQTLIIDDTVLEATQQQYNIYLWIDESKDTNSIAGLSYAGHISAIATQTE